MLPLSVKYNNNKHKIFVLKSISAELEVYFVSPPPPSPCFMILLYILTFVLDSHKFRSLAIVNNCHHTLFYKHYSYHIISSIAIELLLAVSIALAAHLYSRKFILLCCFSFFQICFYFCGLTTFSQSSLERHVHLSF